MQQFAAATAVVRAWVLCFSQPIHRASAPARNFAARDIRLSGKPSLKLAVDVGGTFTDVVLEWDSQRATAKVLTTPDSPEIGVRRGIYEILLATGRCLQDVDLIVHGTTLATNAIIERRGAKTALIGTAGFRDVLEIGTESRYDQYELALDRPKPLVPRPLRFTVRERMDAQGTVRLPLVHQDVVDLIPRLRSMEVTSVAVAFMHAYVNPQHEQIVANILQDALPEICISLSSKVCPEIREYERTSTTVANAYVQPQMSRYLERMSKNLRDGGFAGVLALMTSGGGLTTVETARAFPVRLVESGPAGGVIFAARIAEQLGESSVLAFDMGGTTAKVSLIDNFRWSTARSFEVDRAARFLKGSGLPLTIPCIDMVEIGAGGGSLARVDALLKVVVGPESAASEPGPASYGRGGTEPAVTDADVVMGIVDPDRFAGGTIPLDRARAAEALLHSVGRPLGIGAEGAAYAVYETVCENMANAARVHSVERGTVAGNRTIIAFGGAAPLHAARVAEKVGASRVVIPTHAGVGSAVGFLAAPVSYQSVKTRYMRLDAMDGQGAAALLQEMADEIRAFVAPLAGGAPLTERRLAYMRYVGQGHEIAVGVPTRALTVDDHQQLRDKFETEYVRIFKRIIPGAAIEIMAWSVEMFSASDPVKPVSAVDRIVAPVADTVSLYNGKSDRTVVVPRYQREELVSGMALQGPALIIERETTTFVTDQFDAFIDSVGSIVMERKAVADE
jgi:N-methylhydantoinase A